MIVRDGTGFVRATREFLVKNWVVVIVIVAVEEAVLWLDDRYDLFDANVFSAGAIGMLGTVVGIFLVFRFNEAYQRWWEARIIWGSIVNYSRSFSRQVVTLLTPDRVPSIKSDDEAKALHKQLVYRHLAFINALRLHLRQQNTWHEIAPFLDEEDLAGIQRAKNVPQYLVFRQGEVLTKLIGTDTTQQVLLMQFDTMLNRMYDVQGMCERIKNTAFPDEVRFLSRASVWAVVFAMPVVFLAPGREITPLEVLAVIGITLSFLVVDQLGAALKNPFENMPNDTPMTALCRSIEIDLRQHLGETDLPEPIKPEKGVLM